MNIQQNPYNSYEDINIDESNVKNFLYPETNDSAFSDIIESDDNNHDQQTGGYDENIDQLNNVFIGKSLSELVYQRNKINYTKLCLLHKKS